jgi:excinuclease ABC subunit A
MNEEALIIRGAREHNLKNVDVTIPRDRLTVITGLSGSGKSSLAFDTIYAEGQRRYVESLSAYARQFLGLMEKPDVDSIEGLSPAISIEQKTAGHNPRSTVGTVTEIYDYLRLLYARAGTPHCPNCGRPVQRQSAGQITDAILTWPSGARLEILAPLVRGRKGEFRELFESARKQGFIRAIVDGSMVELANPPKLNKRQNHDVSIDVDRLVVRAEDRNRLNDSVETALKLADGLVEVVRHDGSSASPTLFSERYGCATCGISMPELEPRHFSFNSPFGACPACGGLGTRDEVSEELIVGDPSLSILEGVILPWGEPDGYLRRVILPGLAKGLKFELNAPFGELPQRVRDCLLYGVAKKGAGKLPLPANLEWEGIIANIQRRYSETESDTVRMELAEYMVSKPCDACGGRRLKPQRR